MVKLVCFLHFNPSEIQSACYYLLLLFQNVLDVLLILLLVSLLKKSGGEWLSLVVQELIVYALIQYLRNVCDLDLDLNFMAPILKTLMHILKHVAGLMI